MAQGSRWIPWPVSWSAVWVGVLSALAALLIVGLVAIAIGAAAAGPAQPIVDWSEFGLGAVIFAVFGSFLAFVLGGWVCAKIAGLQYAEVASLHGAIVWLHALPLLMILAAFGAGSFFGGWFGGLAGTPLSAAPAGPPSPEAVTAARNAALGAVTALLLGLGGGVLGGWLASETPMRVRRAVRRVTPGARAT
ncbi:MAG TPA: hypothetical protein VFU46_05445 [Gemmatimonadales bacterium]|nr:hypothetical protein [Gemmatimonadales bacterium]